jgi:hypothetical protein
LRLDKNAPTPRNAPATSTRSRGARPVNGNVGSRTLALNTTGDAAG